MSGLTVGFVACGVLGLLALGLIATRKVAGKKRGLIVVGGAGDCPTDYN